MRSSSQQGFTLVEIAVVLVIAGVVMGGAMAMMKPYVENARLSATREKLSRISDALSQYAQTYGRLPCPAKGRVTGSEPFGAPTNSGSNGTNIANTCGDGGSQNLSTDYIGIIPFRALGLTEDNVRDGYGNLITYAVDPVMAGYSLNGGGTQNGYVHEMCRIEDKWVDTSGIPFNLNKNKARLCCPRYIGSGANRNIQITDKKTGGKNVYSGSLSSSGVYNTPETAVGVSSLTPAEDAKTRLIAFVLVSHGQNGDGAYIKRETGGSLQNPVTAPSGAEESENRDGNDLTFLDEPITKTRNANYFDDIVLWRTNDQLVSAFGNDSCGRP